VHLAGDPGALLGHGQLGPLVLFDLEEAGPVDPELDVAAAVGEVEAEQADDEVGQGQHDEAGGEVGRVAAGGELDGLLDRHDHAQGDPAVPEADPAGDGVEGDAEEGELVAAGADGVARDEPVDGEDGERGGEEPPRPAPAPEQEGGEFQDGHGEGHDVDTEDGAEFGGRDDDAGLGVDLRAERDRPDPLLRRARLDAGEQEADGDDDPVRGARVVIHPAPDAAGVGRLDGGGGSHRAHCVTPARSRAPPSQRTDLYPTLDR